MKGLKWARLLAEYKTVPTAGQAHRPRGVRQSIALSYQGLLLAPSPGGRGHWCRDAVAKR